MLMHSKRHPRLLVAGLSLAAWIAVSTAHAHHEPEEQVASLTAELEEKGLSVEPLLERARLWRVLRKLDLAIGDLKLAVAVDETSLPARIALIEAYYADGQLKPTVALIEETLPLAENPSPERAALHMRRASVRMLWKSYEEAVLDCEEAFAAHPQHDRIEWYLRRAYAQRMAQRFLDCEAGLREGYEANGSIVLYTQWVDALIDAK